MRISQLTKFLPDPVKASEFLCKFSTDLKNDKVLFKTMETIVNPGTDCKTCAEQIVSTVCNQFLVLLGSILNFPVIFYLEPSSEKAWTSCDDKFILQYHQAAS
jgi:hypothetical protein